MHKDSGEITSYLSKAQIQALNAGGVNLHQANGAAAGQVVPHVHFHVVPRFNDDGHHWNWTHRDYESMEAMAAMGARLKDALGNTQ